MFLHSIKPLVQIHLVHVQLQFIRAFILAKPISKGFTLHKMFTNFMVNLVIFIPRYEIINVKHLETKKKTFPM